MENNKKDSSVENDEQDKKVNTSPVAKPTDLSDDDLDVVAGGAKRRLLEGDVWGLRDVKWNLYCPNGLYEFCAVLYRVTLHKHRKIL